MGKYIVTLDKSYFYPTGGGQDHDGGTINNCQVIDVFRDESTLTTKHVIEGILDRGPATCVIDWDRRLRNMQHHTAQHLLSQCILQFLGFPTVSANINGYNPATLDVTADRLLTADEISNVEDLANRIIYENRSVNSYFVSEEDVPRIPLRRQPKVSENIRIVEIDGFDYSACGGTHCTRTGSIGVLKIIKDERINNKTRVHFIAGFQALDQFREYHNILTNLTAVLSVKPKEANGAVAHLLETIKNNQREIQQLKTAHLTIEANSLVENSEKINNNHSLIYANLNRSASDLRKLAEILKNQSKIISVLIAFDNNRLSIVTTCGKDVQLDARMILNTLLSYFDGKGGGDQQIAQGGGTITQENLDTLLNEGYQMIKRMVI
jgi:alanyl-tRNA synthetase